MCRALLLNSVTLLLLPPPFLPSFPPPPPPAPRTVHCGVYCAPCLPYIWVLCMVHIGEQCALAGCSAVCCNENAVCNAVCCDANSYFLCRALAVQITFSCRIFLHLHRFVSHHLITILKSHPKCQTDFYLTPNYVQFQKNIKTKM